MDSLSKRRFSSHSAYGALELPSPAVLLESALARTAGPPERRPNILLCISDDQSWVHTGLGGSKALRTPSFDRVAHEGVLFANAFCGAPQCSPSRAALLTGRNIWQLEEAGVHASSFPSKHCVYTDLLDAAGYWVGYTGKPWGPGNWEIGGWRRNPVGPAYNNRKVASTPTTGISNCDYAANFADFLQEKPAGAPFCFWYGGHEPHRVYEAGSGLRAGKRLEDLLVPAFLPDTAQIRSDILDYFLEIEWFDLHLGQMLDLLEQAGERDNTLVVVTSDNGMPFPRAKANNYEFGTHIPLAMRWPAGVPGGRMVDDLVSFIDLAPTFLAVAGLTPPPAMTGRSLFDLLASNRVGQVDPTRDKALTGRERHTHARPDNLGYPCRAIRTHDYLYIWNLKPNRWPAGDPDGYHDIDESPSKAYMMENRRAVPLRRLFHLGFEGRPEEELYDARKDPACIRNVADRPEHAAAKKRLRSQLEHLLASQRDPRMLGTGDVFESYPRYSFMRDFPGFKAQGEYNPQYQE